MSSGHSIDGTLASWKDVEEIFPWDALLAGNGLSMNVWGGFGYSSLYEEARSISAAKGGLSAEDLALFEAADTENFELVLADLVKTTRFAEALKQDSAPYRERYRSVRGALGKAVRSAHIEWVEAPELVLTTIRTELGRFSRVFTTSYDLLTYWSMGYPDSYDGFCDCFFYGDFDPDRADGWSGRTTVFFLHGALHLVVTGAGEPRKLHRLKAKTLLDQFGEPPAGDPGARPLLISEGTHQDKRQAIEGNAYLAHGIRRLRETETPLVVFGHGLKDQDEHLIETINQHETRPVAVSCRPGGRNKVRKYKSHIRGQLITEGLYFFDSETHPLGNPALTKTRRAPWRAVRAFPGKVSTGIVRPG